MNERSHVKLKKDYGEDELNFEQVPLLFSSPEVAKVLVLVATHQTTYDDDDATKNDIMSLLLLLLNASAASAKIQISFNVSYSF